nr:hypothetical protein [Tanacetum cinerariifolium]
MTELILNECMEKAQAESSLTKPDTDGVMSIELVKEFLMELQSNAYHEMFDEDVVDHIAKNKRRMDDIVSSDKEWEESDYENPHNTTTDSFFKLYLKAQEKNNIEKEDERSLIKRNGNKIDLEINDEQPNKRVSKAEKFEAIKYSLGPNEEYIAIKRCEYNAWERNENSVSQIYREFFWKKDNGWTVTRTE